MMILLFLSLLANSQTATIPNNKLSIGKTGAADKTIEFNLSKAGATANPKIKWNNSSSKLQFSNDGTNFTAFDGVSSDYNSSQMIQNIGLDAAVSANALTVSLKTQDGGDPAGGDPVKVAFRNATITNGTYDIVSVTGALSLVVSSGSTLGTTNAVARDLYVYLINNAGTAELAITGSLIGIDGGVISTAAEGASGGADSALTFYSTTARSNVAAVLIGKINSTQTTAGTWASAVTSIATLPFQKEIVTNNGGARNSVDRSELICSGSSSIVGQNGTWISSIGNISAGTCTVTLGSSQYSNALFECTATITGHTAMTVHRVISFSKLSSTTFAIYCRESGSGSTTIAACGSFSAVVNCQGLK